MGDYGVDTNQDNRKSPSASHGVQSVFKALDLLCSFSLDHTEWGVTEIAAYLGIPKSAAHRILSSCEQYRFIERTDSRRYRLGLRMLELGNVYRFDRRLLTRAEAPLQQLARNTGGIAHLAELDGYDVLELMRAEAPGSTRFTRSPTLRMEAHATALGKVLLAFASPAFQKRFFNCHARLTGYTPYTCTSPDQLRSELKSVVERGYAVSDQESVVACRCMAVPVRNDRGTVVAALSLSGLVQAFDGPNSMAVTEHLSRSARTLSSSL